MAKRIEVGGAHGSAVFEVVRHCQKRPWRRVAVDALGRECCRALMTRDGLFLPPGAVALGYQDADGNDADRSGLIATDDAGRPVRRNRGRSHGVLGLNELSDAGELLDFIIERFDVLSPESVDESLKRSLEAGAIFRVGAKPVFLLANAQGYFLLHGRQVAWDFPAPSQAHVADDALDDDLDAASDGEEDWEW